MLPKELTITPLHFEIAYNECEQAKVIHMNTFDQIDYLTMHCPLHVAFRDLIEGEFQIRGSFLKRENAANVILNHEMLQAIVHPFDQSIRDGHRCIPSESQTFNILETSWTPRYGKLG